MSSEHFRGVSLVEIKEQWTLSELVDAHITLDLLDEVHIKNAPKPRNK